MAIEQLAEDVVNEVATNLEEAAEVTRKLNTVGLSYLAVGIGVGAAVGFYFGYKFNREKIRAEAYKDAEFEVNQLREVYLKKTETLAREGSRDETTVIEGEVPEKPALDDVVESLGYREVAIPERPLAPPVPILDVADVPEGALEDLPENPVGTSKSRDAGWNYEQELLHRTPEAPYVIHQNEYEHSNQEYSKVEYNYYRIDETLTDSEDDHVVTDAEAVVGSANLKFGHGSDDVNVVYVRNDHLELDMQITRLNQSFEEAILGLDRSGIDDDDDDS